MSEPLFIRDHGDGPALVLLHAFPCDGSMWDAQVEAAVADGWRVLVPDLPGFGRSPILDAEPSLDTVVDVLVAELEARDVSRCVVGGISLGGYVAMGLLRTRPDLVAGLLLCDTKASADADAARGNRERLARMVQDEPRETARILEQAVLPGLLGDTTRAMRPDVVDRVRAWLGAASPESVAWYQRAMAARPDSVETLARYRVPTIVVWGAEDTLSGRADQDVMVQASGDADLVVIEGSGHLSTVEDPAAVSAALDRLLNVVRGPQQS